MLQPSQAVLALLKLVVQVLRRVVLAELHAAMYAVAPITGVPARQDASIVAEEALHVP